MWPTVGKIHLKEYVVSCWYSRSQCSPQQKPDATLTGTDQSKPALLWACLPLAQWACSVKTVNFTGVDNERRLYLKHPCPTNQHPSNRLQLALLRRKKSSIMSSKKHSIGGSTMTACDLRCFLDPVVGADWIPSSGQLGCPCREIHRKELKALGPSVPMSK